MSVEELTCGITLTENEMEIRRRFVKEYLVDHDPFAAALRVGYSEAYARSFSQQFMKESYVQQLLAAQTEQLAETSEAEQHKKKIVAGLYRIATSAGASSSAQVAAYSKLASIYGLDAPIKTVQEVIQKEQGPDLAHVSVEDLEKMKIMLYAKPATDQSPRITH